MKIEVTSRPRVLKFLPQFTHGESGLMTVGAVTHLIVRSFDMVVSMNTGQSWNIDGYMLYRAEPLPPGTKLELEIQ